MSTRLLEPRPAKTGVPASAPAASEVLRWLDRLMDTTAEIYLTGCRLILGGVMFTHATQKVFGWFGGAGWSASLQGFREGLGIPLPFALLAIAAEFLGALGLILGLLGRGAALGIIAVMTGAVLLVHAQNGFFMNWMGKAPGEGYEYHLLAIGLALPILARGSGALSLDNWLLGRLRRDRSEAG